MAAKLNRNSVRARVIPGNYADRVLSKLNLHPWALEYFKKKGKNSCVLLENLDNRAAGILKQEMLSLGSDAAVSQDVSRFKKGSSSALVFINLADIKILKSKLAKQPFGLKEAAVKIERALALSPVLKLPLIMGVLNLTPDSFYDGGRYVCPESALERADQLKKDGASIIDVGGESSRPGSKGVSVEEEKKRVLGVVKALCKNKKFKVSIDTVKSEVADLCLGAGAAFINDISAFRSDPDMVKVARDYDCGVILMHMKGSPLAMQKNPFYKDCIREILDFFEDRVDFALKNGVKKNRIVLDPGIGFGKKTEHNLEIIKRLGEFKSLGLPVLAGLSRKSFLGKILGSENNPLPAEERLEGGIAGAIAAFEQGVDYLRVHDPKEVLRALKVYRAIYQA